MSKAGKKLISAAQQAVAVAQGDLDAMGRIRVTPSCGCVFCDLSLPTHEDAQGFHHVAKGGERVPCDRPLLQMGEDLRPTTRKRRTNT